MQLNVTIDLGDLYSEEKTVEEMITDAIKKEVRAKIVEEVCAKDVQKMAEELSLHATSAIRSHMQSRVDSFLAEDIALTDRWGKKSFVGSLEDLMKKKFDEVVLRPVDSNGNALNGCSSSSYTYIEWKLEKELSGGLSKLVREAQDSIHSKIKNEIAARLSEYKDVAIKEQVGAVMATILGK